MAASASNPIYTVNIFHGNKKYDVTGLLIGLSMSESRNQIAKSVSLQISNVMVEGTWLSSVFKVRDRVCIFADDGTKKEEVFRGFVWDRDYRSSISDREISLKCYDHLIYLQKSESAEFFEEGKTTDDIIGTIFTEWGLEYEYSYESITHSKLALRGALSDIITTDILDIVKDRCGKKYVILCEKDTIYIKTVGTNATVYKIAAGENAVSTRSRNSMDGVVTKVVIYGKADKQDRMPVDATLSKNTAAYGTLQKIITRSENETIEDAKEEAQNILKENSTPKVTYEVQAPDIPWIRKGDKIYVNAGDISNKYLIVTDIERSISSRGKKITLELEDM